MSELIKQWRVEPGSKVRLEDIDPRSKADAPGDGSKEAGKEAVAAMAEELNELQNRLWAEKQRSVLLVLQALDAGGKDGTVKAVCGPINPMGLRVKSFKAPTETELDHDFLWRIQREVPEHGEFAVFNRSHYEDVLIVRVDELVPEQVWRNRFRTIREFERGLSTEGTTIVKVYLHISKDEQRQRFEDRLTIPSKNWKFNAADLAVRAKWDHYQEAYEEALAETSAHHAPWYVVPADRKWYRNWAVTSILLHTLREMDPQYPPPAEGLADIVIE
jgi:PPK2 family polyphosphate:nucleotide phosphotransferase